MLIGSITKVKQQLFDFWLTLGENSSLTNERMRVVLPTRAENYKKLRKYEITEKRYRTENKVNYLPNH